MMKTWPILSLLLLSPTMLWSTGKTAKKREIISQEAAENQVLHFFQMTHPADLNDRLVAASDLFLNHEYLLDPLGEGVGTIDADPIYRFDQFDCQTFVETVLALQHAKDLPDFLHRFIGMRYADGLMFYETRQHLVEAQWMPHNIEGGAFSDITAEIGAGNEKLADFAVSNEGLDEFYQPFLLRLGERWPVGTYTISYLPLDWAIANVNKIPTGTIIQVVRQPKEGIPHTVTHQGLYLNIKGKKLLRNASSSPKDHRVIDRDLKKYLEFNKSYFSKKGRWPVIGVNILRVNDI